MSANLVPESSVLKATVDAIVSKADEQAQDALRVDLYKVACHIEATFKPVYGFQPKHLLAFFAHLTYFDKIHGLGVQDATILDEIVRTHFNVSLREAPSQDSHTEISAGESNQPGHKEEPSEVAFKVKYVNQDTLVERFRDKILDTCDKWKRNYTNYYGPYFAVVQSSGYGKSRLSRMVANQKDGKIFEFYLSLAAPHSTAYPWRSVFADHFSYSHGKPKKYLCKQQSEIYIAWCLDTFVKWLADTSTKPSPLNWGKHFAEQTAITLNESIDWIGILSELEKRIKQHNIGPITLLFTFDEARALTTGNAKWFRALRAQLQQTAVELIGSTVVNICGIFLDTTSHVANFAPEKLADPSARIGPEGEVTDTFPPFYLFSTTDIFGEDVLRYGRPLWGAYVKLAPKALIAFAQLKLLGGVKLWSECRNQRYASLAIMSSRFALHIAPHNHVTSQLISTYMGTCVGISDDRTNIQVSYPSEPVLSEAAAALMRDAEVYKFCMNTLQSSVALNIVTNVGDMGELAARMILLRCFDSCTDKGLIKSYMSVKVKAFLEMLFTGEIAAASTAETELIDGQVSFTHFVRVTSYPTRQKLVDCFNRRVALQLWHEAEGVDLLIPVILEHESKFVVSVIAVQVKNRKNSSFGKNLLLDASKAVKSNILTKGGSNVTFPDELPIPTISPAASKKSSPSRQQTPEKKKANTTFQSQGTSSSTPSPSNDTDSPDSPPAKRLKSNVTTPRRITRHQGAALNIPQAFRSHIVLALSLRQMTNLEVRDEEKAKGEGRETEQKEKTQEEDTENMEEGRKENPGKVLNMKQSKSEISASTQKGKGKKEAYEEEVEAEAEDEVEKIKQPAVESSKGKVKAKNKPKAPNTKLVEEYVGSASWTKPKGTVLGILACGVDIYKHLNLYTDWVSDLKKLLSTGPNIYVGKTPQEIEALRRMNSIADVNHVPHIRRPHN